MKHLRGAHDNFISTRSAEIKICSVCDCLRVSAVNLKSHQLYRQSLTIENDKSIIPESFILFIN